MPGSLLLIALTILISVGSVFAQNTPLTAQDSLQAILFGRIIDRFNQGVVNEPVTLVNKNTSKTQTVNTGAGGWFQFYPVTPEEYTLRVRNKDLTPVGVKDTRQLQIIPVQNPELLSPEARWWVNKLQNLMSIISKRPDLKILALMISSVLDHYGVPELRVDALFAVTQSATIRKSASPSQAPPIKRQAHRDS
jgi:hypothetical protein